MSNTMTPERAIEILKNLTYIKVLENNAHSNGVVHSESACKKDNEDLVAIQTAISALEYQIPKKPVIGDTFSEKFQKAIIKTGSNPDMVKGQSYKCPVCNHRIIMLWEVERNKRIYGWKCKDIFCNKCGQALDWRDEE